jgi:MFS family permease
MAQLGGTGQKAIDAAGNVGSGVAASALAWAVTTLGIGLDPALGRLLAGAGFILGVAFALVYRRYAAIITRRRPDERAAYDALRLSLIQGGLPARIYSERLRAVLDAVDRFVGDAGKAEGTLWPQAFGLKRRVPLWTPQAFDRCLLLALLYPVVTIVVMWVASRHVGPAEDALHLRTGMRGWQRGGILVPMLLFGFVLWLPGRAVTSLVEGVAALVLGVVGFVAAAAAAATGSGMAALAFTFVVAAASAAASASDLFGGAALLAVLLSNIIGIAGSIAVYPTSADIRVVLAGFAFVVALNIAVCFAVDFFLNKQARPGVWEGRFYITIRGPAPACGDRNGHSPAGRTRRLKECGPGRQLRAEFLRKAAKNIRDEGIHMLATGILS